jgi:hypothetical protein
VRYKTPYVMRYSTRYLVRYSIPDVMRYKTRHLVRYKVGGLERPVVWQVYHLFTVC